MSAVIVALPTQRKQSSAQAAADVIPFVGKPAAPAMPPTVLAHRAYLLTRCAADMGLSITIHGPVGEARQ